MRSILNLFGRSPFTPLQTHMEKVSDCVHLLPELFENLAKEDQAQVEKLAAILSEKEHYADLTKNDIRTHLPKSLFLAVDRGHLLEILAIQDAIADTAEDIAVLMTLKSLKIFPIFKEPLELFLKKNIEAFDSANNIIHELHQLMESSFGGIEADKVRVMVDNVAYKEHEADVIQRKLLKAFFEAEDLLTMSSFHLWRKIFESVGAIANLSEKLAYRVRMTLELK